MLQLNKINSFKKLYIIYQYKIALFYIQNPLYICKRLDNNMRKKENIWREY